MTHPRMYAAAVLVAAVLGPTIWASIARGATRDGPGPLSTTVTLHPVADAFVAESAPSTNFGATPRLEVQGTGGGSPDERVSLVGFDLSGIPDNAQVTSAGLKLTQYEAGGSTPAEVWLRRVTADWSAGTVTWGTRPAGVDVRSVLVDDHSGVKGWDATDLVRDYWVGRKFGETTNLGVALAGPKDGPAFMRRFRASEYGQDPPQLLVSYILATPSPVPTAVTPEVEIWLVEGCKRTYALGDRVNLRYRASVNDVVEVRDQPTGRVIAQHAVTAGRAYGLQAVIAQPLGQREVEAALLNAKVSGSCPYNVSAPTPSPTPPPTATVTKVPSSTPTTVPTMMPSPTPPAGCLDAYEPNDTFATAYHLASLDPAGLTAYICAPTDEDYYSFAAEMADAIVLDLDELPKDYELELLDPSGALVAASRRPGVEPEHIAFVVSNFAGDFRAHVRSPLGQYEPTRPYRLTVSAETTIPPPLVVNTTDDIDDGTCDAGHCSMREAIAAANAGPSSRIEFDIPATDPGFDGLVWTIQPRPALPVITDRLELDATTQTTSQGDANPNGPEIVLDGSRAGGVALAETRQHALNGLSVLDASAVTIRGFAIGGWGDAGIRAERSIQLGVYGNVIGTNAFATAAMSNEIGVEIVGGHSSRIGGADPGDGNVISGNRTSGIALTGTTYAQIRANKIGTDRTGTLDLGNGLDGILLEGEAQWNRIGGARGTAGNLIAGNTRHGVYMDGTEARYNDVLGNLIGVTVDARDVLPNNGDGVRVYEGDHNHIGDADTAMGNVIGGQIGVQGGNGVRLWAADVNTVAGNFIGVDPTGSLNLGNVGSGVYLLGGAERNTVGPGNTIEHNTRSGVHVDGSDSLRNRITRNRITENDGPGIDNSMGGNNELAPPIITAATLRYVDGSACPRCRVEVYGDFNGEGAELDGVVTATVTGAWTLSGNRPLGPGYVTATATDGDGNTSEFSVCSDPYEPNETQDTAHPIDLDEDIASYVCQGGDVDWYSFPVAAHSVITAQLTVPNPYRLRLYAPDGTRLATAAAADTSTRTLSVTALEGGTYAARVDGNGSSSWHDAYTLRVTASVLPTFARAWVDEGSVGAPAVYKLLPDAGDGPADGVWTDVVVDVTADSPESLEAWVTLEVPDDALDGLIGAYRRLCTGCELVPVTGHGGGGTYWAPLWLSNTRAPLPTGQLVFRFYARDVAAPVTVDPRAQVSYSERGPAVATVDVPPIHFVDYVPAIVITSRHHLYASEAERPDAVQLLAEVTEAAQGRGIGPEGSLQAAIYDVDDYASEARDWNHLTFDTSSSAAANEVPDIVDGLLEDWVDDAGSGGGYVLIVGDDDVVPLHRRQDACDGDDTESAYAISDPDIGRAVAADFYFTDNWYGDTNHSGAHHGELELRVGRLVGDHAADMLSLFRAGLAGPQHAASARAVLASWDHNDLHYGSASYASVLDHARDWGFHVNADLVDNDDWTKAEALDELSTRAFSLMIFATHGNPFSSTAPGRDGISGAEVGQAISVTAPVRMPFVGYGDCRVGYSSVSGGMVDNVVAQGVSGVLAAPGITWGFPAGSENYTEEVYNNFWRRALHGAPQPVGDVLLRAKADYSAGSHWSCRDEKGVIQMTLYGVPWMIIPRIGGASLAEESGAYGRAEAARFGPPAAGERPKDRLEPGPTARPSNEGDWAPASGTEAVIASDAPGRPSGAATRVVSATLDASTYEVSHPAPGLDLVTVEGFGLDLADGVMLPSRDLTLTLPPSATVDDVSVQLAGGRGLGALHLPTYVPGLALYGAERPEQWLATPATVGTVPRVLDDYEVREGTTTRTVHVHVAPVIFDAVAQSATLYERITVEVRYMTATDVAVAELWSDAPFGAPGTLTALRADVVNVGPEAFVVTTTIELVDGLGHEPTVATGGPFDLEPGRTQVAPAFVAPEVEGAYDARLTLWRAGEAVASGRLGLQVVAQQIVGVTAPESVPPGGSANVTVSVANYEAAARRLDIEVFVESEGGLRLARAGGLTATLAGGETSTLRVPWARVGLPAGTYRLLAVVRPEGRAPRTATAPLRVAPTIYLPDVAKGGAK